jgi:hypothetical protein
MLHGQPNVKPQYSIDIPQNLDMAQIFLFWESYGGVFSRRQTDNIYPQLCFTSPKLFIKHNRTYPCQKYLQIKKPANVAFRGALRRNDRGVLFCYLEMSHGVTVRALLQFDWLSVRAAVRSSLCRCALNWHVPSSTVCTSITRNFKQVS